jgi:hypothetical protein
VAHRGEELALRGVRRLRRLLRGDERVVGAPPLRQVARDLGEAEQVAVVLVAERR